MDEERNIEDIEKGDVGKDEQKRSEETMFSTPDANGVRYYSMQQKKQKKSHKLRNSLIVLGVIFAALVVVGVFYKSFGTGDSASADYPSEPYIAELFVEGTIQSSGNSDYFGNTIGYQHQWTLDTIDDLIEDENNKGIIFFVNSPGGGVYESDELYFKIKEYQQETGRPVYSAMGSMAASGGYYISAPCDKIVANRNCWTGSIGVTIGTLYDFSELLERYGVKTNTMTSGANKAMGSSVDPMTDEQRQIFQSLIDEAYEQFASIVAEGRGMDLQTVKKIADGRIYTAKQALELGLIDDIGTLDEAIEDMKVEYDLRDCEVVDLACENTSVFGSLFGDVSLPKQLGNSDVTAIIQLMEDTNDFPVSYMCEALK
jgi:protease-4